MREATVFEWSFDQWAIAFAAFPPTDPLDTDKALATKAAWVAARPYQPGGSLILAADGHKRLEPKDLGSATRLFELAFAQRARLGAR